ncbi:unnamed protein product [Pleuronectes platessa]|uniref:Uncharacterized protein n=1 Tax=Pleuronectes platessa TaxID=8262 RepID=A0A9N7Y9Y3_PLEPL|nr:unnamed protein product [Pleuronectes platessa]
MSEGIVRSPWQESSLRHHDPNQFNRSPSLEDPSCRAVLSHCVKELQECVLSGLCVLNEARPGSTLKTCPPPPPSSAGEVPGTAAGRWVPSEGEGVRLRLRYEHVGEAGPSLVAPAVVRRALT